MWGASGIVLPQPYPHLSGQSLSDLAACFQSPPCSGLPDARTVCSSPFAPRDIPAPSVCPPTNLCWLVPQKFASCGCPGVDTVCSRPCTCSGAQLPLHAYSPATARLYLGGGSCCGLPSNSGPALIQATQWTSLPSHGLQPHHLCWVWTSALEREPNLSFFLSLSFPGFTLDPRYPLEFSLYLIVILLYEFNNSLY